MANWGKITQEIKSVKNDNNEFNNTLKDVSYQIGLKKELYFTYLEEGGRKEDPSGDKDPLTDNDGNIGAVHNFLSKIYEAEYNKGSVKDNISLTIFIMDMIHSNLESGSDPYYYNNTYVDNYNKLVEVREEFNALKKDIQKSIKGR